MRASVAWLKAFCDPGLGAPALAELLTVHGLEVEALVPVPAPSERIVAARLAEVLPVPRTNFKRISADAGEAGRFSVISAAPNARTGMLGALALPGAYLPDGRLIGPREYAGQKSEAMLCSAVEAGLGDVSDRLLELPGDVAPGLALAALYDLPDTCLDVEPTPNRGDCLSILGIARELHAATGATLRKPELPAVPTSFHERVEVRLQAPEACPRYVGRLIEGLDPGASTPVWLAERLRRAAVRSTHPMVDVLNYVMLELGQPMHAFDATSLSGAITVRHANRHETLALLAGQKASLEPDMLVIADNSGAIALAGIMGGASTAVGPATRRVFLESAYFAPAGIRGRARRLGLATEASQRFERGVDPALGSLAIQRATALIGEIAGGAPGPLTVAESASQLPAAARIRLDPSQLERLAGLAVDRPKIEGILRRLDFTVEADGDVLMVTAPSFRFDIENAADLVEEVTRIIGYDSIPVVAPSRRVAIARRVRRPVASDRMVEILTARGYDEALNASFADPERDRAFGPADTTPMKISNPLSERESVLRRSLWPGLTVAMAHNTARQAERARLFERGPVFDTAGTEKARIAGIACGSAWPQQWGVPSRPVDFFDVKGDVEALLATAGLHEPEFVPSAHPALVAGRRARAECGGRMVAELGVVAPEWAARWDLPTETVLFEVDFEALAWPATVEAAPIPRFPSVRRDLSLVVPDPVSAADLLGAVRRHGGGRLRQVQIFDTYSGVGIPSGARSVGLGLIFQDLSRTLTDGEVDQAVSAIMTGLAEEIGAHVRN